MNRILITGDSLSYNRYGYDEEMRMQASECHVGMGSWSFRLRNYFITSAKGFCYGDEIDFATETVKGLGEGYDLSDAVFGERVVSALPVNGEVRFKAKSESGKIVLYLQKRPDVYCRFDIYADGVKVLEKADTFGMVHDYCGYALMTIVIPCNRDESVHEIVFRDFEQCEKAPLVTVAGVSEEPVYADVTGHGSRTSKFMLYHFEERIAQYSPDLMIFILGGNDFIFFNAEEYRENLDELFGKVKVRFPECKLVTVTIPQGKCLDIFKDCNTDEEFNRNYTDKFNAVMKEVTEKYSGICVDTKELFKDIPISEWRFDNIHMTVKGNDILYSEMLKIVG